MNKMMPLSETAVGGFMQPASKILDASAKEFDSTLLDLTNYLHVSLAAEVDDNTKDSRTLQGAIAVKSLMQ